MSSSVPEDFPAVGARVEAMVVGGKPGPPSKYGVGTITGYEWCTVFECWRVNVKFNPPAGKWCGQPINGASTFMHMIHVIGSDERPFSDMSPEEIWELYLDRRTPTGMEPDLKAFLDSLDWTAPCVDLIDDVTDWLMENRPNKSYETCAEQADRLVMPRLK